MISPSTGTRLVNYYTLQLVEAAGPWVMEFNATLYSNFEYVTTASL